MRLQEYDTLKGIGILLVVLGHTGIAGLPYIYIYAFHMPLFFFVSGCFYKRYQFKEIVKRRAKSLLLPWASFATLFLLTNTIISYSTTNNLTSAIVSQISALNIFDEDCKSLFRTIWFLVSLFEVSLLYAILDILPRKFKWICIVACYILGFYLSTRINIPLFLDTSLSCILYYHIGYEFYKFSSYKTIQTKLMPWGMIIILSAAIIYLRPVVNISRNIYPWYLPIIAITYIVSLLLIIKQLPPPPPSYPKLHKFIVKNLWKRQLANIGIS